VLAIRFSQEMPIGRALYFGVFHAISAFCNAGFDLFGDFKSLADYVGDPTVNIAIGCLIILGGLGFTVLVDIGRKIAKRDRFSLHTKLVLISTSILLLVGTLGYYGLERNNDQTMGALSEGDKWLASSFASTTARTAGYASINYELVTDSGKFWTIILMFIGASPGSTGGGIKTVTAFVILLYVWTVISNKEHTVILKRSINPRIIYKSLVISVMALMVVVLSTFILTITEQKPFLNLLFESTSAFATVGLSANVTPTLSPIGEVVIMAMMYIGRLGPLTIALALAARTNDKANLKYPDGNLYVG
jgi:trk system potassium uptake protein TrkH